MADKNKKQEATRSNPNKTKVFEKPGASENLKSTLSEKAKKKD
ncbi:ORF136 [Staphylococcus aureus]|nr:ORF136 [Staphylococcus aureus]